MGTALEWNVDEEKARERRIAERRTRVQERLRLQRQQDAKQENAITGQETAQPLTSTAKGKQQVAVSAETVQALLARHEAAAEAVSTRADQRCEAHRAACDEQEATLREQVAAEAEACRRENRAIDLEWEQLQGIKSPQELAARIADVTAHSARVLESKQGVVAAVNALLVERDKQFVLLLRQQAEETDALIAAMHSWHSELKGAQEQELDAVETAYLQERSALLAVHKAELDALLERRGAAEAEFMEQYLAACEQYENELEKMRVEGLAEHGTLKRELEAEVASLEKHLDGIKAAYMLNADKLDYNYRVLVERERESKEALLQQKRRITRQWEVLNRLRKRHDAAEARAAGENARLSDEYQHVTRAFNHLQTKFRHFKAADLGRFDQVRAMKEEDLAELLEQLLAAEAFIYSFVAGLPPPISLQGTEAPVKGSDAAADEPALELVGQAVAADPLAAAAAAASGDGLPDEVVSVPAVQSVGGSHLIAAYRPVQGVGDQSAAAEGAGGTTSLAPGEAPFGSEVSCTSDAALLDGVAEQELRESADTGALSLLLGPTRLCVHGPQLRRLLDQVPAAAAGGLTAAAVARCLGLQHSSTVAALERAFAGSNSSLAKTVQPRPVDGSKLSGDSFAAAAPAMPAFSAEQVEQGLNSLLRPVLASFGTAGTAAIDTTSCGSSGLQAASQPTSKHYWQRRAGAALPSAVVRAWSLIEAQATKRLSMLQGRTTVADEVLSLRQENDRLKAQLAELLNSAINKELQLPPTLLLQ